MDQLNNRENARDVKVILLLAFIIFISAALRFYGIDWGLPHAYEEAMPLKRACEMWNWDSPENMSLNPQFFNYPSLILYIHFFGQGLLYLGMKLAGVVDSTLECQVLYVVDKTPFYLVGRGITAAFGVATIWVTYLLSRSILGRSWAMAACLLVAINTFHISRSQEIEVDIPLTFFAVLALWLAIRLVETPARKNYILAGLALGLATSTKYPGIILVFPLAAAHLIARGKTTRERPSKASSRKRESTWINFTLAMMLALFVFFASSPYILIDISTFLKHLSLEREHVRLGHFGLESLSAWQFYLNSITDRIMGWPMAVLALIGVICLAGVRRRAWALVIAAFIVPYFLVMISSSMVADRYLLPVLPSAVIFAVGMLGEIARSRYFTPIPRKLQIGVATAVVLLMAVPVFAGYPAHFARLKPDTRSLAKEWIEANIPGGSFILAEAYGPELFSPEILAELNPDLRKAVLERVADTPHYAVQPLFMFQVKPERSAVFYDISLYEVADIVITSSAVRSRYLAEPTRFQRQVAFYDSLETRFERLRSFHPHGGPSPILTIYRNPEHKIPFAGRGEEDEPPLLHHPPETATGLEELFCYNLGLNYEMFGYARQALKCYENGFRYPIRRNKIFQRLVLGKARCLVLLGRREETREFLEKAASLAPERAIREKFLRLRDGIQSRIREPQERD